ENIRLLQTFPKIGNGVIGLAKPKLTEGKGLMTRELGA
ncbi:hypothetical protein PSYMO_37312, partial [Pseudomonas amygdali pv. mori str. 301020]